MNGADLTALHLSLMLAAATVALLLPLALLLGHWLAWREEHTRQQAALGE